MATEHFNFVTDKIEIVINCDCGQKLYCTAGQNNASFDCVCGRRYDAELTVSLEDKDNG